MLSVGLPVRLGRLVRPWLLALLLRARARVRLRESMALPRLRSPEWSPEWSPVPRWLAPLVPELLAPQPKQQRPVRPFVARQPSESELRAR